MHARPGRLFPSSELVNGLGCVATIFRLTYGGPILRPHAATMAPSYLLSKEGDGL
jgi:hypothetical protein